MNFVEDYQSEIKTICEAHNVKGLYVFGSVITERFTDTSDVDLIVYFNDLDPLEFGDYFFGLENQLEILFNRPVDLVSGRAIRNKYFLASVTKTQKMIYGG